MSPATKKVKLRVVGDAVQLNDGSWHHNGQELEVSEKEAKELLESGTVAKA
jgi:hypothetical protein